MSNSEINGTDQVIQNLSKINKKIVREMVYGAQATQAQVINDAKGLCPVGVTAALQNSIQPGPIIVTDSNVEAYVGAYINYASFVEFDTRPHFPPVDALRDWAAKFLGDERLAFVVARAIAKRGTKGRPFMGPSILKNQSTFRRAIQAGIQRGLSA